MTTKINTNLQNEITTYMYLEKQIQIQNMKGETNEKFKIFNKGQLLGFDHAVMIINNWNKPDHGKVRATVT